MNKKNSLIKNINQDDLVIFCFSIIALIIIFSDIIFGDYKFSYTNIMYNMPPFNSMDIEIKGPLLSDVADSFLPSFYDSFVNNKIKFWDSSNAFGLPISDINYLLFPLNYLFFLGLEISQVCRYVLKHLIAFFSMFLFLKNLKYTKRAAFVGGIVFTFSSVMVAWGGWHHTDVMCLAPLLFLLIDKFIIKFSDEGTSSIMNIKYLLLFSIVLFLMLIAGMPTYAAYFIYFGIPYTLFRLISIYKRNYKLLFISLSCIISAVVISGIMSFFYTGDLLLSTSEYQGNRTGQAFFTLDTSYIRTIFFPYWREGLKLHFNESTLFSGILWIFGLPFAIFGRKKKNQKIEIKYWMISAAIVLLLIFTESSGIAFKLLPFINTSLKIRVIVLFNFICSVISALTFEIISEQTDVKKKPKYYLLFAVLIIPIFITMYLKTKVGLNIAIKQESIMHYFYAIWAMAFILIMFICFNKKVLLNILLAVVVCNVAMFAKAYVPLIEKKAEMIPKPTESIEFLQQNVTDKERIVALGKWNLFPNTNVYYGLNDIRSHNFVNTNSDLKNYLTSISSNFYDSPTRTSPEQIDNYNLLSYASVKYIIENSSNNLLEIIDEKITEKSTSRKGISIDGSAKMQQSFIADDNNLSAVHILLATYKQKLSSNDSFTLKLVDKKSNDIVFKEEVNLSTIQDNAFYTCRLKEPISDSFGKEFVLIIQPRNKFKLPLGVWATKDDMYEGIMTIGEQKFEGDVALTTSYGRVFSDGEKVTELTYNPRVFIADSVIVQDSQEAILERMKDEFTPNTIFLLSDGNVQNQSHGLNTSTIDSFIDNDSTISIRASFSKAGYLVLNDYYDSDWKAFVDGNEVPILKANYLFRGIHIADSGTHNIEFVYVPKTLYFTIAISIVGFIIFIILVVSRKKIQQHLNNKIEKVCIRRK